MWGKDALADTVPRARDEERPLPVARRAEHGAENGRRVRAEPAGALEARSVFAGNASGARGITPTLAGADGATRRVVQPDLQGQIRFPGEMVFENGTAIDKNRLFVIWCRTE